MKMMMMMTVSIKWHATSNNVQIIVFYIAFPTILVSNPVLQKEFSGLRENLASLLDAIFKAYK